MSFTPYPKKQAQEVIFSQKSKVMQYKLHTKNILV